MTRAEERANYYAEIARRRDGVEVKVEVEHYDPEYLASGRLYMDGRTYARLTVRETGFLAHGALLASWRTADGLEDRRRTTRFRCRQYQNGRHWRGRMISEQSLRFWLGMIGTTREERSQSHNTIGEDPR